MPRDDDESNDPETFSERVKVTKETDGGALLVRWGMFGQGFLPKSVLHDDSEVFAVGDEGKLIVKRWWAEQCEWWR